MADGAVVLEPVDLDGPAAPERLRDFAAVLAAADEAEWGDASAPWSFWELQVMLASRDVYDARLMLARLGTQVAGVAWLRLPRCDNTDLVEAVVVVHPALRRRGVGTRLLTWVEDQSRLLGRATIVLPSTAAGAPPPPGTDFGDLPVDPRTAALATRFGYSRAQVERRSSLPLPVEPGRLSAAEADAGTRTAGYRIHLWRDEIPARHLRARAALSVAMSADVPLGALRLQEESWDENRLRQMVAQTLARGRTFLEAAVEHVATGVLVGFSDLAVPAESGIAYQWDTFVAADHRGHRLGLALKLANLPALAAARPDVRRIVTWNALENSPMLAINDALGFGGDGLTTEWQKLLTDAEPAEPAEPAELAETAEPTSDWSPEGRGRD